MAPGFRLEHKTKPHAMLTFVHFVYTFIKHVQILPFCVHVVSEMCMHSTDK